MNIRKIELAQTLDAITIIKTCFKKISFCCTKFQVPVPTIFIKKGNSDTYTNKNRHTLILILKPNKLVIYFHW